MNVDGWIETLLGDHVEIKTGFPFKSKDYTEDPSGIALLRGDNIVQGKLRWEGVKRWPENNAKGYDKYVLCEDDVVVAMDRPWIEAGLKYAWITKQDLPCLLVQRVARLRGINGLSTRYARYIIGHHSFTDYVKGIWTGVAVPHISESQIRAFRIQLPPVQVQARITEVLSTYDDLIENSSRRIKILEQMAQMLYREWFVNFRFPGHEKVKMVASEMGLIPERWSVSCIQDYGLVVTGKTPSKDRPEFFGSEIPFIKLPDMHGNLFILHTGEQLSELGQKQQTNKTLPANSICVSCIGTAGIVVITTRPSQTNQQINSVVLRFPHDREFLYFRLLDLKETMNQYGANGATMVNLNKTKFENLRVVQPNTELVEKFHEVAAPTFECIRNLQQRNVNLRVTRDLLLPKLVSGKVSVEALEKEALAQAV